MTAAARRWDLLTKPQGSLGRLEVLGVRLAGMTTQSVPRIGRKVIFTVAADHGVAAEGVSAYPQSVTAQMVRNFLRGGAGINVLARHSGAEVVVVDAGVAGGAGSPPGPGFGRGRAGPHGGQGDHPDELPRRHVARHDHARAQFAGQLYGHHAVFVDVGL